MVAVFDFKESSVDKTLKFFGSSLTLGLSSDKISEYHEKFGYNVLPEKRVNPFLKFLSYFWGPIPWMIEFAAILSLLIHHYTDFWIIFSLLISNSIVAFIEEHNAQNVIALLKKKMALKARVLRNKHWINVDASDLVPGDIVHLSIGNIVPADVKLVNGFVDADESSLTGESLPVNRVEGNIVYSGSIVKRGDADAVVIKTGVHTYFAKSVSLVEEADNVSSLQKSLMKIGEYLIALAIITVVLIFVVALSRGEDFASILKYALILTVASIPAALPTVLSVTLSVGAKNLARKKAVVTKLTSIEELAGSNILCSDKTGTLTMNKLTVANPISFGKFSREDVILYASLASSKETEDPIDSSILAYDKTSENLSKFKVLKFIPFDPVSKRSEAVVKSGNKTLRVAKGAVQVVLKLCKQRADKKLSKTLDDLAANGYRVLAVAIKSGSTWSFVGLIPLFDPPRPDASSAVRLLNTLGVKVKMITGDNLFIARHISSVLKIGKNIVSASKLLTKGKNDNEMYKEVLSADGFSEVFPEHKFKIIKVLQGHGHLVAMTGDGVNDAPALKEANCGIAVSGATDAARAAASVVLLAPGLSVIADAVKEARRVFSRMVNYAIYRVAETIRVLLFMSLSIVVFNFYPITALMIALLSILNDIPILTISLDNVKEFDSPVDWNYKGFFVLTSALGIAGVLSTFSLFYIVKVLLRLSLPIIQTAIFLKLIVAGHSTVFVTRSRKHFWSRPFPDKRLLTAVLTTDLIATLMSVYGILLKPIGWHLAIFIWSYALAWMLFNDLVKLVVLKRYEIEVSRVDESQPDK